jgi:hypothetical protein
LSVFVNRSSRQIDLQVAKEGFVSQRGHNTFADGPSIRMRPDAQIVPDEARIRKEPPAIYQAESIEIARHFTISLNAPIKRLQLGPVIIMCQNLPVIIPPLRHQRRTDLAQAYAVAPPCPDQCET